MGHRKKEAPLNSGGSRTVSPGNAGKGAPAVQEREQERPGKSAGSSKGKAEK